MATGKSIKAPITMLLFMSKLPLCSKEHFTGSCWFEYVKTQRGINCEEIVFTMQ